MNKEPIKLIFKDIKKKTVDSYLMQSTKHGMNPKGVFWQNELTQQARFSSLIKIISENDYFKNFSISDFGCGYGAFYDYIKNYDFMNKSSYIGYDIVPGFVQYAKINFPNGNFICSDKMSMKTEYTVISGTFNLVTSFSVNEWEKYIFNCLENCFINTKKALAFNLLMAKKTIIKNNLYYTTPEKISNFCKNYGETLIVKTKNTNKDMTVFVWM